MIFMDLLQKFRNYGRFHKPKYKVILMLCLLALIFLRFDISYNLWPYQVNRSETLWSIFEKKVFHSSTLTGISLNYLKAQYPLVDWNHIEKNENGEGGYEIYIWFNKINIKAPNNNLVVKDVSILPQTALENHVMEVITYDLLVISLALFIYVNMKENNFRLGQGFIKDTVLIPASLALGGVIILTIGLVLYIGIDYLLRPTIVLISPEGIFYQKQP